MWFNVFGLVFMAVIMIPNVIFAIACKNGFENLWRNKAVETLEQIGRFGCFAFMAFTLPGTGFGFASDEAFAVYLLVDTALTALYCLFWIVLFRKNTVFRALALSILPACIFLFSGIVSRSVLLTAAALLFAPCHILLSYKNAVCAAKRKEQ